MYSLILITHTVIAVAIVVLVLLQQSRGGAGALSGGAASDSFFGSRGSFSFLMKVTSVLAALFFVTSLGLAMISKRDFGSDISPGIIREQQQEQQQPQEGTQLPSFEEQQENLQEEETESNN